MIKLHLSSLFVGTGLLASAASFAVASAPTAPTIAHNTPKFVATAKNLGAVDPSTVIEVSIWLNPHNKAELNSVVKDLYNPKSANYRHWLTKAQFSARYAPTAEEGKAVESFFTSNNLKVVSVAPDNFFVRARGTVAQVSKAFQVPINNYEFKGQTVRSNSKDPSVSAAVASLVSSVAGLDTMTYEHPLVSRESNLPSAALKANARSAATPAAAGPAFDPKCFNLGAAGGDVSFTTEGSLPTASYVGNGYSTNPAGCGYTPQNIYTAYNLTPLYKAGYDGTGQTIVIIDWCGSPTILTDANAFSAQFGLPALTSSNFSIINYPGPSYCSAPDPEINIDVEWAHAIAPGAAIDLLVPPSPSFQDIDQAFYYAVDAQLGNNISGSYGAEESELPDSELINQSLIAETASALGISANFSSGDSGDFTYDDPIDSPASVSTPASLPYATAIGGVSLALKANSTIAWQGGWGTNETLLADEGTVFDPALNFGFNFGSGGGPSGYFPKPAYQGSLKGSTRQVPDISWLADPFTGAYIAITQPFALPAVQYTVYGGTSLACPMFSALWAIANQEAGEPLGQAAQYVYTLPASTIIDILPASSKTNVTGTIVDSAGTTSYSANSLVVPLGNTTHYISGVWNYPLTQDTAYIITFGTDSGLVVTPGYDSVTGVGVPNGAAFADFFKP